ncbi:hypothetical protein N5C46_10450 [Rossellomorea vietnamensis]|uniref:Uncharacterized protein n=1 Tax=Rossellomorea vietnamensis TaxID=218284 RepID=A0ACD4CD20_9BACI|nr:hypothetical protein [Rossellomorea vietnamensis]UXH46435.1 hypothetical protein N5C46_10450 [Rossellomorea vietnamensis]
MVNKVNEFLNNFMEEKLELLCDELLSEKMKMKYGLHYHSYGISFENVFAELTFILMYEENSYELFQNHLFRMAYCLLERTPIKELTLLSMGISRKDVYAKEESLLQEISRRIIELANKKVLILLSLQSDEIYDIYIHQILEHIMAIPCGIANFEDYKIQSYWDEFCVIIQEGYDYHLGFFYEEIIDYILGVLRKVPIVELKLLYSGTDEVWDQGHQNPLSIHEGTYDSIANRMFNLISYIASSEHIDHILFPELEGIDE